MSTEKQVASMVVAFDGPSKCGKTTFAEMVAEEARFQKGFYAGAELPDDWHLTEQIRSSVAEWSEAINFRHISTLSAGNIFRAAAYHVMLREAEGVHKDSFSPEDVGAVRDLLATEDIIDFLQNDPEVGRRVSPTAKFAGAQALCGTMFCEAILEAYERDGGSNLVIVDARDPIGHMRRNHILGDGPGKVLPASILPLYIDTPVETAASRLKGNLQDNIALVRARRHDDATRAELPVSPPEDLSDDFHDWFWSLPRTRDGYIPTHFLARNSAEISLENIQYLAGIVAATAHTNGLELNNALHSGMDRLIDVANRNPDSA